MTDEEKVVAARCLLAVLRRIEDGLAHENGICSFARNDAQSSLLEKIMPMWHEYSGDLTFPVPHPVLGSRTAYFHASAEEMWDRDRPYGAARWRLLEFCIEELAHIAGGPQTPPVGDME